MLIGIVALCVGAAWLVFQPRLLATYHYNQYVISLTHLLVLGWICSVVMGAMYQMAPVALETRLYSEKLAWGHLTFHLVGVVGMVWMFRTWNMKHIGHFGSLLTVGVGLFVFNMAKTLLRVPKWNVTASAVAAGLFWISSGVSAGLLIAVGKCSYDSAEGLATAGGVRTLVGGLRSLAAFMSRFDTLSAMHAHAHLSGVGFFTMLIVGVSYKLIPMFTLSDIQSKRRAAGSVLLLNVSLAGSFASILLRSPWKVAFALGVVGALALYGWELAAILRARKRRMLDWGIKYFLTAVALLLPMTVLAVVLSWPSLPLNAFTGQLENVYGLLGLVGVISFAIIGMLYKIVPFLVWFTRYSRLVGRAQVPALADLYSTRLQAIGYWVFLAGLASACAATLASSEIAARLGCGLIGLCVATLALNVGAMLSHLFKPRISPFMATTPILARPAC